MTQNAVFWDEIAGDPIRLAHVGMFAVQQEVGLLRFGTSTL